MRTARVHFHATLWDEAPAGEGELEALPRLSRVHATNLYEGAIEGTSVLEYLFLYASDAYGSYTGYEQIDGSVDGREGSFCLKHEGTFDTEGITLAVTVVEGAGRGDLGALRGGGSMVAKHGEEDVPLAFSWEFSE